MDSKKKTNTVKYFNPGEKIFFKIYKKNKEYWEESVIKKCVGRILYMIKGLSQLKKQYSDSRDTRLEKNNDSVV